MREVGKLFVDGRDAMLEYGIFVEKGGYKGVVQMPQFKTIEKIEWEEYDGEEADLTSPVLDAKSVTIPFCITNVRFAEDLFAALCDKAYHTFVFSDLKREYRLRMTSVGSFSSLLKLGKLQLTFSDDFPPTPIAQPYELGQSGIKQLGYVIDGIDFSQFGSHILKGTDESIRKAPNIRPALNISHKTEAGLVYDEIAVPRFKAKDITVKLLIRCSDIDEFWKRYGSLFAVLTKNESRVLYFPKLDAEYECYYKSCNVQKFEITPSGRVWCEFDVVLCCISSRPRTTYCVLIAEDGSLIITEPKEAAILFRKTF